MPALPCHRIIFTYQPGGGAGNGLFTRMLHRYFVQTNTAAEVKNNFLWRSNK